MKKQKRLTLGIVSGVFALTGLGEVSASTMSLTVNYTATFLPADGVYQYNFTVANCLSDSAFLVTINNAPTEQLIQDTASAPTNFSIDYNPSFNIIDLAGDDPAEFEVFAVDSTVTDFTFQSAAAPGTAFDTFTAYLNDDDFTEVTGSTTQIPEPSSTLLILSGAVAFTFRRRRVA